MKKRTLATVIAGFAAAAVLLAGCGSSAGGNTGTNSQTQSSTSSEESSSAASESSSDAENVDAMSSASLTVDSDKAASAKKSAEDAATSDSKVLVVYYSASDSGNTEAAADMIASAVGGNLFRITPKDPYSDDEINFNDDNSRVSREHENEELQNQVELTTTKVDNWDSYDTVFIGYPIWWGNAAWPVNQFVQNNDFSGKTVIPFATSQMSDISNSGELLADMAGTGNWQQGRRFAEDPSENDVTEWAKEAVK